MECVCGCVCVHSLQIDCRYKWLSVYCLCDWSMCTPPSPDDEVVENRRMDCLNYYCHLCFMKKGWILTLNSLFTEKQKQLWIYISYANHFLTMSYEYEARNPRLDHRKDFFFFFLSDQMCWALHGGKLRFKGPGINKPTLDLDKTYH